MPRLSWESPSSGGSGGSAGGITSINGAAPITVAVAGSLRTIAITGATQAASGSLSPDDKTKLDGVEAGAQVVTFARVAAALSGALGVATTVEGPVKARYNALGTGIAAALTAENFTPATSGLQQPAYVKIAGQGWKTIGPAASQEVAYWLQTLPVQSSANPNQRLMVYYQVNSGSLGTAFFHDVTDVNFGSSLHADCYAVRSGGPGLRFDSPENHGGFDLDSSSNMRVKSYANGGGTQHGFTVETGHDSGGSGGITAMSLAGTGTQTYTLPVGLAHRIVWGTKVAEQRLGNLVDVTSAGTFVVASFTATNETIYEVEAVFLMWLNNTDYAKFRRTATFYHDGGTLSQLGTTETVGVDRFSAGFATCTTTLDATGTTIRGIATGVAATTIQTSCVMTVTAYTP